VRVVLQEADEETRNCLLSQIDRQPVAELAEWFVNSDAETRASARSCVPILNRLCGSSDESCREFALKALADLGTSPAWNVLETLMTEADDTLRAATYKAVFAATTAPPRLTGVIGKALGDVSASIRLLGMDIATANPKLVGVDTLLELVRADPSNEIRANAACLLAQHYGEQGQLALVAVALSAHEKETWKLALDSLQAVRGHIDGDMKRLLALTNKRVEGRKKLSFMDRRFCRSLRKRRPATCTLIDLLTA
jgi:hypothetical protein